MKIKQGESVILLFLKINRSITMSMKRSRRELSIDIVDMFIFWSDIIGLRPFFTFVPQTGIGQPKTGVRFYKGWTSIVLSIRKSNSHVHIVAYLFSDHKYSSSNMILCLWVCSRNWRTFHPSVKCQIVECWGNINLNECLRRTMSEDV